MSGWTTKIIEFVEEKFASCDADAKSDIVDAISRTIDAVIKTDGTSVADYSYDEVEYLLEIGEAYRIDAAFLTNSFDNWLKF